MKKILRQISIVAIGILLMQLTSYSQKIMPTLERSINLVEDSWAILDKVKNELWPEWDNYKHIAYFTSVLKKQDLLINPPLDPQSNFKLIKTKIYPIKVYLREPGETEKIWGGAYRYEINGKRYKGAQFHSRSEEYSKTVYHNFSESYSKQDSSYFHDLYYSDNFYKSIITHEAFHIWQTNIAKMKSINQKHESSFSPNEKYQLLANKEGEILSEAFLCNDPVKLKELSKNSYRFVKSEGHF